MRVLGLIISIISSIIMKISLEKQGQNTHLRETTWLFLLLVSFEYISLLVSKYVFNNK